MTCLKNSVNSVNYKRTVTLYNKCHTLYYFLHSSIMILEFVKLSLLATLRDKFFNPIQDGGEGKTAPPTSFSPVISTNVRISPQNFLAFSFDPLTGWCKIWSLYLVSVPNYWTWTKTMPKKNRFPWSNPYKIEVMITSLIQMLD